MNDMNDWKVINVLCRECGHKWVAVIPGNMPANNLQCPRCQKQQSIEIPEIEEIQ